MHRSWTEPRTPGSLQYKYRGCLFAHLIKWTDRNIFVTDCSFHYSVNVKQNHTIKIPPYKYKTDRVNTMQEFWIFKIKHNKIVWYFRSRGDSKQQTGQTAQQKQNNQSLYSARHTEDIFKIITVSCSRWNGSSQGLFVLEIPAEADLLRDISVLRIHNSSRDQCMSYNSTLFLKHISLSLRVSRPSLAASYSPAHNTVHVHGEEHFGSISTSTKQTSSRCRKFTRRRINIARIFPISKLGLPDILRGLA
jgi:hypothetical protein